MGKAFGGENSFNVEGTGQTVGDLKNAGWSKADMDSMGLKASPNNWQKGIGGALSGGGGALQKQQGQQPKGSPVQIDVAQAPQIDMPWATPGYMDRLRNPQMSDDPRMGGMAGRVNPQAFYGGY